jgi:cytochrome c556
MAKGEAPFELAKAKEVFATYEAAGKHFYTLFPDNSKTGGDTAALPKIWENMADFKARSEKLAADAQKASASVTDHDSFKAAMGEVTKNCGGCHPTYRANKSFCVTSRRFGGAGAGHRPAPFPVRTAAVLPTWSRS